MQAHCTGTGILSDTAQRELNNELCIQESCALFSRSSQPGSVATAFAMFRELRRCIGETVYMSPEPHGLQRSMGGEGRPGNGGVTYRYRWRVYIYIYIFNDQDSIYRGPPCRRRFGWRIRPCSVGNIRREKHSPN